MAVHSLGRGGIDFDPKKGTYGNNKLVCPCCGQVTTGTYLRSEGMAGRIREEPILAIEVSSKRSGRFYRLLSAADRAAIQRAEALAREVTPIEGDVSPDRPSTNARGLSAVTRYGMLKFADFFNPRQTVVLDRYSRKVTEVYRKVLDEGEDQEFAQAIAVYLAMALDRIANQCSSLSRWHNTGEKIEGVYSKQAVAMIWDYIESNPTGSASGSWTGAIRWGLNVIRANSFGNPAHVLMGSSTNLAQRGVRVDAVITDPPYYDSVPYSDISDFFYVWLRRTLGEVLPGVLSGTLTPKRREIIQHNPRHGGERAARDFYEREMTRTFEEMARVTEDDGIFVIVFAHKSTSAWETLLSSLLSADLVVTASWPVDTEMRARTGAQGAASLASSVFIVCRKRTAHHDGFLDEVEPELKERLHERLDYFWSQGIRGADFFMSAIGPAVEVFGRYKRVIRLTGEPVGVDELLKKVRAIVADYALRRIVEGAATGDVDDASRFYVIWRWAFGTGQVDAGEAIHMAQSMGVEFNELVADRGVLLKTGSKVRLKGAEDRAGQRGLGQRREDGSYAPLIDVLHAAANLWSAGDRQMLADFLEVALPPGGVERLHRLAQSIVDVLAPGDKERTLYENFLVGSRSLPAPSKSKAELQQTSLFSGERVAKHHIQVETYGEIDELNAVIGLLAAGLPGGLPDVKTHLEIIQSSLFHIGAWIAASPESDRIKSLTAISPNWTLSLESAMDEMDTRLEPLRMFILPGGTVSAARAHLARTVCRRCERRLTQLMEIDHIQGEAKTQWNRALVCLNRLSDYFFVLARSCNAVENLPDIPAKE